MQTTSISNKLKSQIKKIAWITLFWVLISVLQQFQGYVTLIQFKCNDCLNGLSVAKLLTVSIFTGLLGGLLIGGLIVFFWEKWLRTMAYSRSLLNIFWSYTLFYLVVSVSSGLFFHSNQLNIGFFHIQAWQAILTDLKSGIELQYYVFWLLTVMLTLIALLVSDKYGPGVFVSFILGRYFHPKREERIFMFLDLRGATTIAEQLGERQYFNFLKDVFKDATPGILNSKGEIYQYVGDEIVTSWKKDSGIQNANCLRCFYDIQQRLMDKASYYRKTYDGIVPEFKAGLHYGFVMVGEIGIVKRDIAYSGDVLNTTARIQSKCNELGVNILISKYLLDKLESLSIPFEPTKIREMKLRGKKEAVMLYTVHMNSLKGKE
jgi:adenylate cyclase